MKENPVFSETTQYPFVPQDNDPVSAQEKNDAGGETLQPPYKDRHQSGLKMGESWVRILKLEGCGF